jgi:hypothetical protein
MAASTQKGKLVEGIAARFHACPGVKVETNRKLPPRNGKGGPREIDVLLTSDNVSGYTLRIAIECKNEEAPIEAEYIDAFIGKLNYVGIPTQNSVYISASAYRSGAKERAEEAGIMLLNLTGLTPDRLTAIISEAFQSVIHLILEVEGFAITNHADAMPHPGVLVTENRQVALTIHDLVWLMWRRGKVPPTIGKHEVDVEIPDGLFEDINGRLERPLAIEASIKVMGIVFTYQGETTEHALVNAHDKSVEKWNVQTRFEEASPLSVVVVHSEEELKVLLKNPGRIQVVAGRFLMPRIVMRGRFGWCYWPPSQKAWDRIKDLAFTYGIEGDIDPNVLKANPLESQDVGAILDPIAEEYPLQATFDWDRIGI